MSAKTDYLFRYPRSQNWYARFQYPKELQAQYGKVKEFSTGTSDRAEAELRILDQVREHRQRILEATQRRNRPIAFAFHSYLVPLGMVELEDGSTRMSTPEKVVTIKKDGTKTSMPNARVGMGTYDYDPAKPSTLKGAEYLSPKPGASAKPKPKPTTDNDLVHIQRWINEMRISQHLQREAMEAWTNFRRLTDNRPLSECTRDDGRLLRDYYFEERGHKSATVQKKIGHLCAAVNLAIDEQQLRFNPFAKLFNKKRSQKQSDALVRVPFSDEDMAVMRANLHLLDPEERLLWVLLATTGMRRSEAWHIEEEFFELGTRYVQVGSKTEASKRRVPLPEAALPFLPAKITGPLFPKSAKNLGRELIRAFRSFGITDERKVLHSLRHRAKDKIRDNRIQMDVQYELLGHEKKTVAAGYGKGTAIDLLKTDIDKIGY